jgi:hypothetical protein
MLEFGRASLAPAVIATIMTVCALFAVAIVLIELGLQTEKKFGATIGKVTRSLITNPFHLARDGHVMSCRSDALAHIKKPGAWEPGKSTVGARWRRSMVDEPHESAIKPCVFRWSLLQ